MGIARDIALIFLSLEALAMGLVPLILLGGLAYGLYRLKAPLRNGLRKGQEYAAKMAASAEKISHTVTRPFISLYGAWQWLVTVLGLLLGRSK